MTGEHKVITGRGGAGNVAILKEAPSPKLVPQGSQTPVLLQPVYSTGRGGVGNMRQNVDPKLTRKAQDVDGDNGVQNNEDVISSGSLTKIKSMQSERTGGSGTPKSYSIGRGGAGNILSPSNSMRKKDSKRPDMFAKLKKKLFG
ncbi:Par32p Ecym_4712 [Eremothecium cymbalariae DBVPG|uniref:Uncharacterized protein n=1 Tax=Eremothecium cymbalariae (strain CBS 270.75 / DBVPG 7215 / KCTC 17166 / NRRL Y-17582) TaxID=931890 RepID=G8JSL0_ERECY|nr:hypothetical protein Ecym_4712 [Eremothecium cymbalariae DBVPG\